MGKNIQGSRVSVRNRTRMLANMAMMLAVIFTLTTLEHMLPPLPLMPPNVKLGLSNIVTMYTFFFLGRKQAFILALLKSTFIFLTRGPMAGTMSVCGGVFSLLVILLAVVAFRGKPSYLMLSVFGALAHNFAQIAIASIMLSTAIIKFYWPILTISGVVMGCITGILLRTVMPFLDKIFTNRE